MCCVGISVIIVARAHAPSRNHRGHHARARMRACSASIALRRIARAHASTLHNSTADCHRRGEQRRTCVARRRRRDRRRRATATRLRSGCRTSNAAAWLHRPNTRCDSRLESSPRHGHRESPSGTLLFCATHRRRDRRSSPSLRSQRGHRSLRRRDKLFMCNARIAPPLHASRRRPHARTPRRKQSLRRLNTADDRTNLVVTHSLAHAHAGNVCLGR
jgi:hypothetical protein